MNKRIGLVGVGVVGERIIQQINNTKGIEIQGIVDGNEKRAAWIAEQYDLEKYDSVRSLIESKPDWIYIGTPPKSHAPLATQIAEAGIHIMCEKPLAHDAYDGLHMVQQVAEHQVENVMHFPLMYSPAVATLRKCIQAERFGDLKAVELHMEFPVWPRPWQQNDWIALKEEGGFIREITPHYFQLLLSLVGEVKLTSHQVQYPTDPLLCEESVQAIGLINEKIPFTLNGMSGIGQEERIECIFYGTHQVISLKNWSEVWVQSESSAFHQLSVKDAVPSFVESVLDTADHDSIKVRFEEGQVIQRLIDELLKIEE